MAPREVPTPLPGSSNQAENNKNSLRINYDKLENIYNNKINRIKFEQNGHNTIFMKEKLETVIERNEDKNYDEPNKLMLQMDVTNDKHSSMILDTGAAGSLIKLGALKNGVIINADETFFLNGINQGESIETLGTVLVKITINNDVQIEHKFNVVKDTFPIETGMIGRDFLQKFRTNISYDDNKIKIYFSENEFVFIPMTTTKNSMFIAARTEMFIRVSTSFTEDVVSLAQELQENVFVGNCITKPKNNLAYVSVINANDTDVILEKPPTLVPLKQFNVLFTTTKRNIHSNRDSNQTISNDRFNKVKNLIQENIDENLNIEERDQLLRIIESNLDMFHLEGESLTCTNNYKHTIPLYSNTEPIYIKPYRIPQSQKKIVNDEIERLLKENILQHSVSAWNAPLLLVPKKKTSPDAIQKHRLCVDFRKLNEHTISDRFPLGNINDILDQLGNSRYFSTLDLASGFHQIELDSKSQELTAFSCNFGHYEYKRMCFGLKNAPASFQRFLNHILTGLNGVKCLVYLDDIIIHAKSLQDHEEKLSEVLKVLKDNNLKLQPSKCHFLRKEIKYLGHVISEKGISPNPEKIDAVAKISRPRNVKELKSFISMANYYRNFIAGFSEIAEPMNRLLRKKIPFIWSELCEESFLLLKEKLTSSPVLAYPDFDKPFHLTTDASNFALGAVLSQEYDGEDRVVGYASRILNPAERNYNTSEKELLSVVYGCSVFRCYLYGREFVLFTDHKPLLGDSKHPPLRILKWKLKLSEYSYETRHKPGKQNVVADCLSRTRHDIILMMTRAQKAKQNNISVVDTDESIRKQKELENHKVNQRPMTTEEVQEVLGTGSGKRKISNRAKYIGNIKIIMDPNEKIKLLDEAHNSLVGGHQGVYRTFKFLRQFANWPYMFKDIAKYIKKCKLCQKHKNFTKTKVPMAITSTSSEAFDKVFLDVVGPLQETENGNKYILTMQDDLTKYSLAAAMPNQTTPIVAKTLFDSFISVLGLPKVYLTDRGTNFESMLFKDLCKLLKITKISTSSFHPQSNGGLERWHRFLSEYIRHFTQKHPDTWDRYISAAVYSYNVHENRITNQTPFEMLFGRKANVPSCFKREVEPVYNTDDYVLDLKYRLQEMHQIARQNIVKSKLIAKKYYDRNARPFNVKEGDLVLIRDEKREGKFSPLKLGPYEVIKVISPENSLVKIKNKTKVVHNNRLSIFTPDNDSSNHDDLI